MKKVAKKCILWLIVCCLTFSICSVSEAYAMRKGSRISVFASDGNSVGGDVVLEQKSGYSRVAETIVKRELRKSGYKIVDAALNNKIKNEAVMALANGDPKRILEAVKKYQIDYIVNVSLSDRQAVVNDFGLYTSSVAVILQLLSNKTAEFIFDDLFSAKAVGGTAEEATRLAVQKASERICEILIMEGGL